MEQRVVTIIGGTGFVGRYVVKLLASAGYTLRVISRHPNAALALKTSGYVGQIVLTKGNIADPHSLAEQIKGSYAVINLTGILYESGKQTFAHVHAQGSEKLAQLAKAADVKRFIQMSALGVDNAPTSHYARTKLLGEQAVLGAFPEATVLRPSVIFGPEDNFFNQFATMACLAPALPLIGGGQTRFQPVYVGDVAKAIEVCLTRTDCMGDIYELGGPQVYSFKDILEYIRRTVHSSRPLVNIPIRLAAVMGTACQYLPKPPITRDQVELLKYDNVVQSSAKTLANLGINASAVELIVPEYLSRFHRKAA